ncbi:MAG: hypothetical protein Q4B81_00220 [Moraxella sp.]|nr:hypothetical protein [Moraxella sp.]
MLIELSQLPLAIQEQILNNNTSMVQIVNNGQVIKTMQLSEPKSYAYGDFDYDLEQMKQAIEAPYVTVPNFESAEELLHWMENLSDDDFVAETRFLEKV